MPKSSPESVIEPTESGRCSCNRCRVHDTGARGPYSPQDFIRLFGVANDPTPVEVPAELAALGIAVDVARARYDAAKDEWVAAHRSVAAAESAQSRETGTPSTSQRHALDAARDDIAAAKEQLDEAGEVLDRAQVAYNSLAVRLSQRATIDAYVADQAAQAAERDAARERALAASRRRGLRAIKAKVTGAKT